MSSSLTFSAVLQLVDRMSPALRRVTQQSAALTTAMRQQQRTVRDLERQQGMIDSYRKQQQALAKLKQNLASTTQRQQQLSAAMQASGAPTQKQIDQMLRLTQTLQRQKLERQQQVTSLAQLRTNLQQAGVQTGNLANHEQRLQQSIRAANDALAQQRASLDQVSQRQKRLSELQSNHQRTQQGLSEARSMGMAATMTGAAGLHYGVMPSIEAAKEYELQMARLRATGVSDEVARMADHTATHGGVKGVNRLQALEVFTEANSILRNPQEVEHLMPRLLKQYSVLTALYAKNGSQDAEGDAVRAVRDAVKVIELRGGAKSVDAFQREQDYMMKAILGSGGTVSPTEYRNMIATGGVAAKMADAETFYYKGGHFAQEAGGHRAGTGAMAIFTNLVQGRMTKQVANYLADMQVIPRHLIQKTTDKSGELKIDKNNIVGKDLLIKDPYAWINEVLVPRIKASGVTDDTDIKLAIANAFSRNTGSNAAMQAFIEEGNLKRQVAAYRASQNLDQAYQNVSGTAQGATQDLDAKKLDLQIELGQKLLPLYVRLLESLNNLVTSMTTFADKHPFLAKAIMITLAALAALLIVFGTASMVIASVLGPFAMMRWAAATLGFSFTGAAAGAWALVSPFVPLIILVGALALAGYLLYSRWSDIAPVLQAVGSAIIDFVTMPIRGAIGAINLLISAINRIPGVNIPSLPNIPELYKSGDLSAAFSGIPNPARVGTKTVPPLLAKRGSQVTQNFGGNTITINGNASTDMLALMNQTLDKRDRDNAARARSSLQDR